VGCELTGLADDLAEVCQQRGLAPTIFRDQNQRMRASVLKELRKDRVIGLVGHISSREIKQLVLVLLSLSVNSRI